jgi:glycosyltransferase involved in cell wall biosynthesis
MKIGIHNEPTSGGVGGCEISVARLAEALSKQHTVEIIHHKPALTREQLAAYSGTDLSAVSLRYAQPEAYEFGSSRYPWRRYKDARLWRSSFSRPYDLFVSFVHGFPSFCHAPRGVLTVLFPLEEPPYLKAKRRLDPAAPSSLKRSLKHAYHRWEWKQRLAGYQQKIAISRFSKEWTTRRWGIDCDVIYPPVDIEFDVEKKTNLILSVGRFATEGHSKKQLEMLSAFAELKDELREWQYFSVGGIGDSAAGRAYFEEAVQMGQDSGAQVKGNIDRGCLKSLYQRSKIFWHAAGLNEDEERYPELSEHFGIVTVEAMAAGCVPIVINKGGQPEIVEHGVSGFVWNTVDELKEYTLRVAQDEEVRVRMSEAARCRAQLFSTESFLKRYLEVLGV